MSNTPRTDCHIAWNPQWGGGVVSADFARMLERENAELAEALLDIAECIQPKNDDVITDAMMVSNVRRLMEFKRDFLLPLLLAQQAKRGKAAT